ncbi:T9SS type A sorting domain-containing protein [Aquimarina sp. 2201CG1-2-11]|uniref:T9SS type A sorting domain-containing protein n=1 Tax=Aquimarina discodermiae TaxID=3231043 RepID=UPI0034629C1C
MKKILILLCFFSLASFVANGQYQYILDSDRSTISCPGGNGVGSTTISITLTDNSVHSLTTSPIQEFPKKISKVTVRQRYISFINCVIPNCDKTIETIIDDNNCLTKIQTPGCSGFIVSKLDLYKVENLLSLNPIPREICDDKEVTLNVFSCSNPYPYSIEYMYNGIGWTPLVGLGNHGRKYIIKYQDIPNLSGKPNVNFRIKYHTGASSKSITYEVLNCSPELDGPIVDIQPSCTNSLNVADNDNGSFTVTFDRELDDTRQEKMKIEVWDLVNGVWDGFEPKVIEKIDFNGRSYTWNPRNLPGGTYKLFWQTKSNNDPFDNANSTPDKFGESPSFVLTTPPVLSVNGIPTDVQCVGGNDGSITVTGNGGTPGNSPTYEYSIDNGVNWQTSTLFDGLTKGDYLVIIRDGNSCEVVSSTITVNERFPNLPDINGLIITDPTLIDGNNGSILITVSSGSGNYTNYVWTKDGNPFTPPAGSTNTSIVDLYEGVYTVIVTDSNGCNSEIETFTLTDPEPIDITINMTPDTLDCSDTLVNLIAVATGGHLDPDGEYSYLWNEGTTNPSLNNVGIGTYQVTVTDNGGNSQVQEINVEGPNLITVTPIDKNELSCRDGSDAGIQLDIQGGTGDYVITWEKIAAPDFSAFGTTLQNIGHGAYIYRVVDENGCMVTNASQPIEFTNPPLFTIDLGEDPFFCEGQTVTISAAISDPQATYNWTSTTGFTSTNPEITVDQEGAYTAIVTSGKGCIAEDTINVIENIKEITAEFLYTSQVFTNEKMVMIDVTYPVPTEVEWIIPDAAEVISQNQDLAELSFDTPGEYEITLISKLGDCQDTYTQKVLVLQGEAIEETIDTQIQQLGNIQEFKAYPNPSDGQFAIKVMLKEEKEISIKVFNLTDNTLLKHISTTGKKEYDIPFTLQIATGVYAIVLETPYGNAIRKLIIK